VISRKTLYFSLYLGILVFLALPVVKIGPARIEQLLVLVTFGIVFLDDLLKREVDFMILAYLVGGALVLVLISMSSPYEKVAETGYYIKFLFIYPVGFYVGARILSKVDFKTFLDIVDWALLFYFVSWFVVMYIPLPESVLERIIHFREFGWGREFLPYQGTFYEAGAIGVIVGSILLLSVMSRVEFDIWPRKKYYAWLLYGGIVYMMFLSKNKTVWLAYMLILLFLVIMKGYLKLTRSSFYTSPDKLREDPVLYKFHHINGTYLIGAAIFLVAAFFIYNSLASHPFITAEEFNYKMQHERGAQFREAWDLIVKSNFWGGYGFGFVESYFKGKHIMGVGAGSGSINSVLLDSWLQGSILAVVYLSGIVWLGFDKRHFVTIVVPAFFLFFGLTNPIVAEELFLILGISYSIASIRDQRELTGGVRIDR